MDHLIHAVIAAGSLILWYETHLLVFCVVSTGPLRRESARNFVVTLHQTENFYSDATATEIERVHTHFVREDVTT